MDYYAHYERERKKRDREREREKLPKIGRRQRCSDPNPLEDHRQHLPFYICGIGIDLVARAVAKIEWKEGDETQMCRETERMLRVLCNLNTAQNIFIDASSFSTASTA